MRTTIGLLATAALLVPVLGAGAQGDVPPSQGGQAALAEFHTLDRNGDGGISAAELQVLGRRKAADALFSLLDERGQGRIALADLSRRGNAALVSRFRSYDVNRDGVVTRNEFPNFVDPALFAALDRNHDGQLTLAELRPAFAGLNTVQVAAPPSPHPNTARPPKPSAQMGCWAPVVSRSNGAWLAMPPLLSTPCQP